MNADRSTKLLLTVIALELGWIAVGNFGVQVSAQRAEPTPVIIRGVEAAPGKEAFIPVAVVGSTVLRIESARPLEVVASQPIKIQADGPIPVETGSQPLLIQTISDPPATRPGVAPDAFKR